MVPRYRSTLYTGRILQGYIVISLVLLAILVLFYAMFLAYGRQSEPKCKASAGKSFSFSSSRPATITSALPLRKPVRHGTISATIFFSCLPWQNTAIWKKSKNTFPAQPAKFPTRTCISVKIRQLDSVLGYYCALAKRENIPFQARVDLPASACHRRDRSLPRSLQPSGKCSGSQPEDERLPGGKIDVMICPSPYASSSHSSREHLRWKNRAEKYRFPVLQTPRERHRHPVCAAYR